jgi:hypothetical protein
LDEAAVIAFSYFGAAISRKAPTAKQGRVNQKMERENRTFDEEEEVPVDIAFGDAGRAG